MASAPLAMRAVTKMMNSRPDAVPLTDVDCSPVEGSMSLTVTGQR
jgi:hypothetical protein